MHSDGDSAEILAMYNPGTHGNYWVQEKLADYDDAEIGEMFMSHAMLDKAQNFPFMDGPAVFKKAVIKIPEAVMEALADMEAGDLGTPLEEFDREFRREHGIEPKK